MMTNPFRLALLAVFFGLGLGTLAVYNLWQRSPRSVPDVAAAGPVSGGEPTLAATGTISAKERGADDTAGANMAQIQIVAAPGGTGGATTTIAAEGQGPDGGDKKAPERAAGTQAQPLPQAKAQNVSYPVAPAISSDTWLNSPKLNWIELRGKVVLVEFWTFGCINCRNTLPSVKKWYDRYADKGLVVLGVHTPEFDYEHQAANVSNSLKELGIKYPVALDNDFKNWNAYNTWAWPSLFLIDKGGYVRFQHVGEGAYAEMEQRIQELLKE